MGGPDPLFAPHEKISVSPRMIGSQVRQVCMERIVVRPDRRQEIGTGGVRDSGSGAIAHRRRGERTGGGEQQDPEESNRSSPEPGSVDERERGHTAGQAVERKKGWPRYRPRAEEL